MKNRALLLATATIAMVALAITGCSSGATTSTPNSNAVPSYGKCAVTGTQGSIHLKTVKPDVLSVVTVLPNPGFWNGTSPDTVDSGFEYCMFADLAYRAGLKSIELKNLAWDQYISGTVTDYDVGGASTSITPAREKIMDFSQPYFSSNLGVATLVDSKVTANNIRTVKIGVLQGNAGGDYVVKTLKPSIQPSLFPAQQDMVTALLAGQIDAFVTDTTLALTLVSGQKDKMTVVGQYKLDQGYGITTPLGSANSKVVNDAVGQMSKDGTLKALSKTYLEPLFGMNPDDVPFWILK